MSCSNQIICYTSPHLSLHVPFFFLLVILTHCYVIVNSFYYPPLQAYLQYKKSLSNTIHLSHRQIQILASLYFSSYNKILYHNNCYFSSKKAPKHFCPSAIKSYFYTLTSNPFLNMNLISSLAFTITSCTKLLQIPASNS